MTSTQASTGNSTDIESATPSAEDESIAVANSVVKAYRKLSEVPVAPITTPNKVYRKLSTVSKMYDIDGNGELDAAELAMRTMDKSGRGYLTNDKVYKMIQEQLETQKQLFQVKRIMFM